jgi:molybdenum cofactor biosynthesis enzyme MoaA
MTEKKSENLTSRFQRQYDKNANSEILKVSPPFPRNIMIELTNACNHACVFCTSPHMTRKIARMNSGLLDRILREARELGVEDIGFYTTGEPFVHKDLARFVGIAKGLGYRYVYISTNGAMASPQRAKAAIDAGLDSIKFSINAGSRETYKEIHGSDDWDGVLNNLRFISEYRKTLDRPLKLFVTYVVTKPTAHETEGFRALVGGLVDEILFHPVHNQSGQMNEANKLLAASPGVGFKADNICVMPFNRLHVSCEGYLTICCVDYQNYLALADLSKMSLAEAWDSPKFREIRQRHLDQRLRGTLCGNCWQGHQDQVEPLSPEFATRVDFARFYNKGSEAVAQRLHHDRHVADKPSTSGSEPKRSSAHPAPIETGR